MSVSMEDIQSLGLVLVTFGCFVFAIAIAPLMIALDSLKEPPSRQKSLWTMFIVLIWPIGSYAYAFFRGKTSHRLSVILGIGLLTLSSFGMAVTIQSAYRLAADQISWLRKHVSSRFDHDISASERQKLLEDLTRLQGELLEGSWYEFDRKLAIMNLIEMLSQMLMDGTLQRQEFDYWIERFLARRDLPQDAVEEYRGAFSTR